MRIKSLEIHNILSIADAKVEFGTSDLVLLEGWNFDDDTSNGSGKTSIFNAMSFGLYGKAPRKISSSEFLKDNTKTGHAIVVVEAANTWTVKRYRPNKVEFFRDDELVDSTQEEFEKAIGLNYNQFLVSMYNAQVEGKNFLYLNDTGKKEFLLQLLNLEEFSDAKKAADDEIKTLQKQIDELNLLITSSEAKIGAYQESIKDVDDCRTRISDNIRKIGTYREQKSLADDISVPDVTKYAAMETKLRAKYKEVAEAKAETSMLRQQIRSIENQISVLHNDTSHKPDANCPHCDKEVMVVGKQLRKADSLGHKSNKQDKIDLLNSQLVDLSSGIQNLYKTVNKEADLNTLETKINQQKIVEAQEYNDATRRSIQLQSSIKSLENLNQSLENEILKNTELETKISQLQTKVEKSNLEANKLLVNQDFLRAASMLFAPTGAPAYIMDSIIDAFNEAVEQYVALVWPNAKYRLLSYKENSSKSTVAKFSEELVINGQEKSIGALSGGEQRCLSLAVDFAIIDVLSNRYSIAINPMVMDEPFTGLDTSNRERVIDLLEKLAVNRQIWIIDHCNESKAMFSQVVRIEKRNGSSQIV